jgi:hypothetical protein
MASDPIRDYINNNTRSKTPSAKFKKIGDKVVGTINAARIVETVDRNTHEKVQNLVVELSLDHGVEEGAALEAGTIRSVWFKPGEMLRRLGDAMKDSQVESLITGDKLAVDFYGEEPTKQVSPKKLYRVAYKVVASANQAPAPSAEDLI